MSFSSRPVNLKEPYCHSFISSAHKWFIGPKETGILYMDPKKARNVMPSIIAYDYKIEFPKKLPDTARRFELLGQRDDVNIIQLHLAQFIWTLLQPRKPYQRVAELSQYLMTLLKKNGWTLVTPDNPERSWGIVWVKAPAKDKAPTLSDFLYQAHGICGSGNEKEFRLSPHIYNTKRDIERAVVGMEDWRKSHMQMGEPK
jgi:selenocysteine lyase/cysteine desulfurase